MVDVIESTFVVPCEETPKKKLTLSNFEQLPSIHYSSTVYLYGSNNGAAGTDLSDFFSIEVMKAALARALVLFYPLAGRLLVGHDGWRAVDCNAEGVLLVVARSERCSDDIDFRPSPELRDQFVPKTASSSLMAMFQVTYLKCGGVVLGTATNFVLVDGRSAFYFLQTWARVARGELDSIVPPCFNYALIHARAPPKITFDYPDYAVDQAMNTPTICSSRVATKLKLSNKQISLLKSRCNGGSTTNNRVSTFCAISAFFWKCHCIAQELPSGTEAQFHFPVDIRNRVQPPLPETFFGNTVFRTCVSAKVTKLTSSPISVVSNIVKAAVDGLTKEYVRSFIDYMEVNRHNKLSLTKEIPKSDLCVSNLTRMPVYEADFGWGAPQLMTLAEIHGTNIIYIMNDSDNSGVVAHGVFDSDSVRKFEKAFNEELCLLQS